jgi:hypothetical protein
MTEAEWLACDEPRTMFAALGGKASARRWRLFACGCLRQIWRRTGFTRRDRHVVKMAELHADGLIGGRKMARAFRSAGWGYEPAVTHDFQLVNWSLEASRVAGMAFEAVVAPTGRGDDVQRTVLVRLLHCLFAHQMQPVRVEPSWFAWQGGTAAHLAQTIYKDHAFDRLPILADALEEAGCADAAILGHCRSPGPHVRGCWVVDLLLGKA